MQSKIRQHSFSVMSVKCFHIFSFIFPTETEKLQIEYFDSNVFTYVINSASNSAVTFSQLRIFLWNGTDL